MSAAGAFTPRVSVSPEAVVCPGGPGQRAPVQPAGSESSLCADRGPVWSSWTLWTESLQPAACCTSSRSESSACVDCEIPCPT